MFFMIITVICFLYLNSKKISKDEKEYKKVRLYSLNDAALSFRKKSKTKVFEYSIYGSFNPSLFTKKSIHRIKLEITFHRGDHKISKDEIINFKATDFKILNKDILSKGLGNKVLIGPKRYFISSENLNNVDQISLFSEDTDEDAQLYVRFFSVEDNKNFETKKSWARTNPETKGEIQELSLAYDADNRLDEQDSYSKIKKTAVTPVNSSFTKSNQVSRVELLKRPLFSNYKSVFVSDKKLQWFRIREERKLNLRLESIMENINIELLNFETKSVRSISLDNKFPKSISVQKGIYALRTTNGKKTMLSLDLSDGAFVDAPFELRQYSFIESFEVISFNLYKGISDPKRLRVIFPGEQKKCDLFLDLDGRKRSIENINSRTNHNLSYFNYRMIDLSHENIFYFNNSNFEKISVKSNCDILARLEKLNVFSITNARPFHWVLLDPEDNFFSSEQVTNQTMDPFVNESFYSSLISLKPDLILDSRYFSFILSDQISDYSEIYQKISLNKGSEYESKSNHSFVFLNCYKSRLAVYNPEKTLSYNSLKNSIKYTFSDSKMSFRNLDDKCQIYQNKDILVDEPSFKLQKFYSFSEVVNLKFDYDFHNSTVFFKLLIPNNSKNFTLKIRGINDESSSLLKSSLNRIDFFLNSSEVEIPVIVEHLNDYDSDFKSMEFPYKLLKKYFKESEVSLELSSDLDDEIWFRAFLATNKLSGSDFESLKQIDERDLGFDLNGYESSFDDNVYKFIDYE